MEDKKITIRDWIPAIKSYVSGEKVLTCPFCGGNKVYARQGFNSEYFADTEQKRTILSCPECKENCGFDETVEKRIRELQ